MTVNRREIEMLQNLRASLEGSEVSDVAIAIMHLAMRHDEDITNIADNVYELNETMQQILTEMRARGKRETTYVI